MLLKLGTRRSALALTQSNWVKAQLEALHTSLTVELVGMDTQGDEVHGNRFSTEPLQTLDGKNFFVKELDEALLAGKTDFSVHSYKDLSLDRPENLVVAAIPARENPRDIVIFHPSIHEKLATGSEIVIGSASPRRAQNTPEFLASVLPRKGFRIQDSGFRIVMRPLRGNVTTRVKKLADGEYDGIILAMAGLNRLALDIARFPKMILPLDVCPTAPAQGALAIECRADDAKTIEILAALHHTPTAAHIAREREVLKRFGGGCHQAFGATSLDLAPNLPMIFVRGRSDGGKMLDHVEWNAPRYDGKIVAWDGTTHRTETQTVAMPNAQCPMPNAFASHHRAVPKNLPQPQRLWCAGVTSWKKLAELGLWVEGCAEGLGIAHVAPMLGDVNAWTVLTHEGAECGDRGTVATYRIEPSTEEATGLGKATHVWWGSGSQFLRLRHLASNVKHHACGAGKTAEILRAHGITPDIFPNRKEWKKAVSNLLS